MTIWYASPTGLSTNLGTQASPWNARYAMWDNTTVQAGDTVALMDGVYDNESGIRLPNGTTANPITVTALNKFKAVLRRATTIYSSNIIMKDFEIYYPYTSRVSAQITSHPTDLEYRGNGVTAAANNIKIINNHIHDMEQGISVGNTCLNIEVYGNIIYNVGWIAPDRGHGHGIYPQNSSATYPLIVEKNVVFDTFSAYNLHIYAESPQIRNVIARSNVTFNGTDLFGGYSFFEDISVIDNRHFDKEGGYLRLGYNYMYNDNILVQGNYYERMVFTGWEDMIISNNKYDQIDFNPSPAEATRVISGSQAFPNSNEIIWLSNDYDSSKILVIYNPQLLANITVSVPFTNYTIYNVQNMAESQTTNVIDMDGWTRVLPKGYGTYLGPFTGPEFMVFYVEGDEEAPVSPTISPLGIASVSAFGSPTVSVGSASLTVLPSGISSGEGFGNPDVYGSAVIFQDDFEDGTTNAWDIVSGTSLVSESAAIVGTYGFRTDASFEYVKKNISFPSRELRFRLYFDVSNLSAPYGYYLIPLIFEGTTYSVRLFVAVNRIYAGNTSIFTQVIDDTGTTKNTTGENIYPATSYIAYEVHIVGSSTESSNDGYVETWINGVPSYGRTGLDIYDFFTDIYRVTLGYENLYDELSGYIDYDEIVIRNDGEEIGILDLDILPTGISSDEAFGTPALSGGALSVYPAGFGSDEEFGAPTVERVYQPSTPSAITADVTDDFNRANENPIVGNWTSKIKSTHNDCQLLSNVLDGTSGNWNSAYWNAELFQNVQAAYTMADVGASYYFYLYARLSNVGGTAINGYGFAIGVTEQSAGLKRVDNGVTTSIGDSAVVNVSTGDKIGLIILGSELYGLIYQSGSWSVVCQATDSTYTEAGYVGIMFYPNAAVDDFIGDEYLIEETIVADGIGSEETFGTPSISSDDSEILPTGIASSETFGTPSIFSESTELFPTGISSTEMFGATRVYVGQIYEDSGSPVYEHSIRSEYYVVLRDTAFGNPIVFDSWNELSYELLLNDVGAYSLSLHVTDPRIELFVLDYFVFVYRSVPELGLDFYLDFVGLHRTIEYSVSSDGKRSFKSRGFHINDLLRRKIINYPEATIKSYKEAPSETVMKEYVKENIGVLATVTEGREYDGVFPYVDVDEDSAQGTVWEGDRAYQNLLSVLQEVALFSGIDFGLAVDRERSEINFSTYIDQYGEDKTTEGLDSSTGLNSNGNSPVVFDVMFNNVQDLLYTDDRASEATVASMLGEGDGATRKVVMVTSTARTDSIFNAIEISRPESGYESQMTAAGVELLKDMAEQQEVQLNPLQQPSCMYGIHFNLGDRVTLNILGQQYHRKITEVSVSVPDVEKISITFSKYSV